MFQIEADLWIWLDLDLCIKMSNKLLYSTLEGAARYAGLLLAPAEGFGRGHFLPFGQKIKFFFGLFWPNFGNFW